METSVLKRPSTKELVFERTLPVSRQTVWRAWTQPEHLAQWFGPMHWNVAIHEMDVRPEGVWRYTLTANDGNGLARGRAIFKEIDEPSRLVYIDSFADAQWQSIPGTEMTTTVMLHDVPEGTKVTITTQFASAQQLENTASMGMAEGLNQAFERLHTYITTLKED